MRAEVSYIQETYKISLPYVGANSINDANFVKHTGPLNETPSHQHLLPFDPPRHQHLLSSDLAVGIQSRAQKA